MDAWTQSFCHTCAVDLLYKPMTAVGIPRLSLRVLRPLNRATLPKRSCFRATISMSTASKTDVVKGKTDDMKGKNVIVTGANSGIGLALSKALVSRGAHVTVASRNNDKCAEYVFLVYALSIQNILDPPALFCWEAKYCHWRPVVSLTHACVHARASVCQPVAHSLLKRELCLQGCQSPAGCG